MLYYVICITITILICSSNCKPLESLKSEPERCCWIKQFSADTTLSINITSPNGKNEEILITASYSYDAALGLTVMKGISLNTLSGEQSLLWVIQSIKDKRIYTIDETSKECSISPLPFAPVECIPKTATYVYSNTSQSNDTDIISDTWLVKSYGTSVYTTVSHDDLCIPLSGELLAPQTGMKSSQTFTNIVTEIKDQNIFRIPKRCLLDD